MLVITTLGASSLFERGASGTKQLNTSFLQLFSNLLFVTRTSVRCVPVSRGIKHSKLTGQTQTLCTPCPVPLRESSLEQVDFLRQSQLRPLTYRAFVS
jgi:hypothetical protein